LLHIIFPGYNGLAPLEIVGESSPGRNDAGSPPVDDSGSMLPRAWRHGA